MTIPTKSVWLCALVLCFSAPPTRAQSPAPPPPTADSDAPNLLSQLDSALTDLFRKVRGNIVTLEGVFAPDINSPFIRSSLPFDLLERLPDLSNPQFNGGTTLRVSGSGFVMKGGFVVSTAEVAAQMRDPMVTMVDGRRAKAVLIKHDLASNVAVFRVEGMSPELGVTWGASDRVSSGSLAITIGNQAGYAHSASLGMVSGTGRMGKSGELRYPNLIQFQGTIGTGNSGGPLFNARGELIGMIVGTPASASRSNRQAVDSQGIRIELEASEAPLSNLSSVGFAIPSNEVRAIAELLRDGKTPRAKAGWIGLSVEFGGGMDSKAVPAAIRAIFAGSAAERSGLKVGDVVKEIDGKVLESPREIRGILSRSHAGEPMKFRVQRGSDLLFFTVIPDPRPDEDTIRKMRRRDKPTKTGTAECVPTLVG